MRDGFGSQLLHHLCSHALAAANATHFWPGAWQSIDHIDGDVAIRRFLIRVAALLPGAAPAASKPCKTPLLVRRSCVHEVALCNYEEILPLYRRKLPCAQRQVRHLAMHIRRGDVKVTSGVRWVPAQHYHNVAMWWMNSQKEHIHLHSEGSPSDFPWCKLPMCVLKLNIDVIEAFHDSVCARHFVGTTSSSLSMVIALLRAANSTLLVNHRHSFPGVLPSRWHLGRVDDNRTSLSNMGLLPTM